MFAPTNEAFAAFVASHPENANDTDYMHALMQYHTIKETYASAEFGSTPPLFPQTLLTSNIYVNITGGQRIHLSLQDSKPTVFSGFKAASHLVESDIFYRAGFVHVIDSVLTIPQSIAATVTGAKLTHLAALLNIGGWLSPDSIAKQILNDRSDLTVFAPNDPRYGVGFTGFDNLSENALNAIFQYSFVQELDPLYSSALKSNTSYSTLAPGLRLLFTKVNEESYVDSARITQMDYLVSNGVLHITDAPMNPETSGIGPVIDTPDPRPDARGLSPGARAGLGVGIAVVAVFAVLAVIFLLRRRRGQPVLGGLPIFGNKGHRLPEEEAAASELSKNDPRYGYNLHGMHKAELADTAPPPEYPIQELESKQHTRPHGRGAARPPHGKSTSVVEILDVPQVPTHASDSAGTVRTIDTDGRTVITYASDSQTSQTTPIPQEIDGSERRRSRINISIIGDTPQHLGFQARY